MKRIDYLDYAKGLALIGIIAVHVGFAQLMKVLLFALPVFFMVTGYCYNSGKRSKKENIVLRFKSIMIPFWVFMVVYTLIEVFRAPLFGYGTWEMVFPSVAKLVYGSGIIPFENEVTTYLRGIMSYKGQSICGVDVILPTNCHLWFLPAMFTGYVMFVAVAERTRNSHWFKVLVIGILLFVASLEAVYPSLCQLPYGIGRGCLGAAYMLVGFWMKESGALEKESVGYHGLTCLAAFAVYVLAIGLGADGSGLVRSYYGPHGVFSVFLTFVGGAAGVWLILELCRGIEKLSYVKIKGFLSFVGRNTMVIYLLHMAVKFVFDVFYMVVFHKAGEILWDEYKMGLVPETALWYMIIEIGLVIGGCMFIAKQWQKFKKCKCTEGCKK